MVPLSPAKPVRAIARHVAVLAAFLSCARGCGPGGGGGCSVPLVLLDAPAAR